MSFLWDSLYNVFARTRNYHVDPPGEENPENPENPELAITGEGRGATIRVLECTSITVTDVTLKEIDRRLVDYVHVRLRLITVVCNCLKYGIVIV